MTKMKSYYLIFTTILLSGCASTQGFAPATPVMSSPAAAEESTVLVSLHRLGAVNVPVPRQGTTLRRVVGDARDLASQGGNIILTHAINNVPIENENSPNEDGIAPKDLKLFVGEECIIVARGDTLMIVPEVLATSTAMGSSRVFPGDVIQTIPIQLVDKLKESRGGTITVSSEHFDAVAVLAQEATNLGQICDFPHWNTRDAFLGTPPVLNPEMLRPNVAAISRSYGGINYLLIFPCQVFDIADGDTPPPSELLAFNSTMQSVIINTFTFSDGDVVHLTRLENIPTVALGLSLPVPDRASPVGAAQATICPTHAEQLCSDSRQGILRVPGVSALRQAKHRVVTQMTQLLPNL